VFLTSSYVPLDQLEGWLSTVAAWNPVSYLLEGLRSLISEGWVWSDLGAALLAIAIVGAVSMTLCFGPLRGRIRRG
jgi:ABC-2 type transport system permease protein